MHSKLVEKILTARVYDVAIETPLDPAKSLSKRYKNNILLKREDLQAVFSFKLRGAFNRMFQLTEEEKSRGVVAASAGNHAQGVAISGQKLGIETTIVMPKITPEIKVNGVKSYGGKAVLVGNNFDDAYAYAMKLCEENGLTFIHPFDDVDVIAGQGTIGMELLRQHPDLIDIVFVCVGGGGLISGIASYIKYLSPSTKIIGVEHEEAPSMFEAVKQGKVVELETIGTFADGAAVRQAGHNTFEIVKDLVDEIITVSTDETCAAIRDVFEDTRTMVEPAGALAVAGLKKYVVQHQIENQQLIAISSGANINFDRLKHVAERAEIGEKREAIFGVTFPERPGALLHFLTSLGGKWNISLFHYRNHGSDFGRVLTGIQVPTAELTTFTQSLEKLGYEYWDETDNPAYRSFLK
ncbi:UNVERIFIED_CONTAM: hypothetical protein GTU68_017055 [Idotea baltica]|nr:hypothetical protein [Idotea baltica]